MYGQVDTQEKGVNVYAPPAAAAAATAGDAGWMLEVQSAAAARQADRWAGRQAGSRLRQKMLSVGSIATWAP